MKYAVVFPGQGWQFPGMGYELYCGDETFHRIFEEADRNLDFDLLEVCFSGKEIIRTDYVQPVVYVICYALYEMFLEKGMLPECPYYLAGHSLGEYAALTASGALSFEDGLALVQTRGRLMAEPQKEEGKMAAVQSVDLKLLHCICRECSSGDEYVSISNYNSTVQTVIAGTKAAVEKACGRLIAQGKRTSMLKVSNAFHCRMMAEAAEAFGKELSACTIRETAIPVISNVSGRPYQNREEIKIYLERQIVEPVQWVKTVEFMKEQGITDIVEMTFKGVLTPFIRQTVLQMNTFLYQGQEPDFICYENELETLRFLRKLILTNQSFCGNDRTFSEAVIAPYMELCEAVSKLEKGREGTDLRFVPMWAERVKQMLKYKGVLTSELGREIDRFVMGSVSFKEKERK